MVPVRGVRVVLSLVLLLAAVPLPPRASDTHRDPGAADGGPVLPDVPPASPHGHPYAWAATPTDVPGTWTYGGGELILTDHPFDDHGADLDGSDGLSDNPAERDSLLRGANAAAGHAGDFTYPAGYERNSADIVEVRVASGEDSWYVIVVLNTLIDPQRTAVALEMSHEDGPCAGIVMHGAVAPPPTA